VLAGRSGFRDLTLVSTIQKFKERNCSAYDGCEWEASGPRVVLLPLYFQEWGSSNFSS